MLVVYCSHSQLCYRKSTGFIRYFPLYYPCATGLDLEINFLSPASLLLPFPLFHPPVTLGYRLRVRLHASLRASAVQIRLEAIGQKPWEGEGPGRGGKARGQEMVTY